jgi:hypothetical protein
LISIDFRGGGKCPEEEHTTCSGGPTIVIVTSAVYGERENYSLKKRIIYKKKENVINNKIRKSVILPLKMELFTLEFRVFRLFF